MMKLVPRLSSLLVLASVCLVPPAALAQAPVVMKLGTASQNDAQHEFLKRYADAINKRSGGRIKAEVYPSSQLGPIPREIEGVQLGGIQGFTTPAEFFEGVDPRFQVLTAPGLFQDMDHANRVLKDPKFREEFYKLGSSRGLVVGTYFLSGPTALNSRTPINHVADIKNLKLRVMASAMQTNPIRELGASPVPMALGDVLPALQQGTIDGAASVLTTLTGMRFYDAAKYITETDFSMTVSAFVLSKVWLDKLPPDLQKIVVDSAREIGDDLQPYVISYYAEQRKAWQAGGGTVLRLPEAERQSAMKELSGVAQKVVDGNKAIGDIYKVVSDAAERTRK
jgi:TRAP-type C4-dicarboxylate transport system substrate-binding protein